MTRPKSEQARRDALSVPLSRIDVGNLACLSSFVMKIMRVSLSVLMVAFFSVVGFSWRTTLSSDSPRRGELITAFGEHDVLGGALTVRVSEHDGKLEVIRGRYFDMLTATNPATGEVSI